MITTALGYTPPKQDTNTWRDVVDNLTSTATDKSLSANQGKVLKDEIDMVNNAENNTYQALQDLTYNYLKNVYPVGSIYLSVNSTDPESLFGGIWERIEDRFLLGAGSSYSAGSTGGESSHTLTWSEMPQHSHQENGLVYVYAPEGTYRSKVITDNNGAQNIVNNISSKPYTGTAGSGSSHNNMPPYLTVYIWKRTA